MPDDIPHTYLVRRKRKARRNQWELSIALPGGGRDRLESYPSQGQAVACARLLAGYAGTVKVQQ